MPFRIQHRLPASPQLATANGSFHAPGRFAAMRPLSTIAFPGRRFFPALQRTCRRAATGVWAFVRESGLTQHWRFLLIMALLSFAAAWTGTRAVMAGVEDTWTGLALQSARHENQELRGRQEVLRARTADALARLETAEAVEASYARTP